MCLIPSSAHGTNAASAVMAGMEVVVVACDERGNVDVGDLAAKAELHRDRLSAVMITYPSTHGVFEEAIEEICRIVHEHGGQVYLDGANLNAMVGLARPGEFGADVSHLNLHKTFTIPHGGGGPGVGPVGVKEHLAPFLPNHPMRAGGRARDGIGPVASAPWGSAGILPISYAYIRMMGAGGLRRGNRGGDPQRQLPGTPLHPHFPVLYAGSNGRVAHECILDLRPISQGDRHHRRGCGQAPRRLRVPCPNPSFPVAGTLMVEPTERRASRSSTGSATR